MTRAGVDEQTFWSHVDKSFGDCWMWTGSTSKPGPSASEYGKYGNRGVAHRVAYELLIGLIPTGLELDHLCCQTLCVNPSHLEPVTRAENVRRRSAALTHCKYGHPLTDENTVGDTKKCRLCDRRRSLDYYYRRRRSPDVGFLDRVCRNGHVRTDENTYVSPQGQRYCRECRKSRESVQ